MPRNHCKCPFGTGCVFRVSTLVNVSRISETATGRIKSFRCIFKLSFEMIANMSARKWQNAANCTVFIFSQTNFALPLISEFFDVELKCSMWHRTSAYCPELSLVGVIKTFRTLLMCGSHLVPLTWVGFKTLIPS